MTIKEQAYRAHAFLRARGVASLKRSHVHELLAAAVGYSTHAAFQHDATWCDMPFSVTGIDPDLSAIRARCQDLGLPADEGEQIVEVLPFFLRDAGHAPVRFDALIAAIEGYDDDPDWLEWVWHVVEPRYTASGRDIEHQRVLREGLEQAAERGVSAAHLAIAKLLEAEAMLFGDEEERMRRQVMREGTWTSPFVSFAEIEANGLRVYDKHRHHLLAAARGGNIRALMETAQRYGDPAVLEQAPSDEMDPMAMAEIAAEHDDIEKVRFWLTVAAQEGDIGAMRELILGYGEQGEQAWVWMHLSRLLDDDLSQDRYEAINEDGSPYDDDIGGAAYVGGYEGINLKPLPSEADAAARQMARQLFAQINAECGPI
ncbi:hypothetical protein N800_11520 [Lysobacter daejeonensis GH1-9]|uniref:Uncharacterized protein n=1 Tax=Lysobacter daejeonensis GH1-9 TaxID=1385517 RepID=A0A0A0EZL6_9GAMM|nr:hypothetical protein [Lysobacter daejeonensis]KGM55745.1 hypothetical protein N800_11520 [Lysobacter daejeonensis GH1-9]